MKNLKEILLEASLLDIDSQLDVTDSDIDNAMLYNLIMSKDSDKFKEARNVIYNETIKCKKLVRKSSFKKGNVYIQFMREDDYKEKDVWGFRIGTCNPVREDKDFSDIDLIISIPNINLAKFGVGLSVIYGGKQDPMKLNSYLKRPTYQLPNRFIDLYKRITKECLSNKMPHNPSLPKLLDNIK